MDKLDALLEFLEENLDLEHARDSERLHLEAMRCKYVPCLPVTCFFKPGKVEWSPYEEAFHYPE